MNKIFSCVMGTMFLWGGLGIAIAQEGPATTPPPKVMQIIHEFVSPEKAAPRMRKGRAHLCRHLPAPSGRPVTLRRLR